MARFKSKIVELLDLEDIEAGSGSVIKLRMEVFFDFHGNCYDVNVYKMDFYSVRPSFDVEGFSEESDVLIYVLDPNFLEKSFQSESADGAIKKCLKEINFLFGFADK